ncbi:hypothetical protein CP8484711_2171B, partial [Chlamydia psittaci 84-8471/1]
NNLGALFLLK